LKVISSKYFKKMKFFYLLCILPTFLIGQNNYSSYFTGNASDSDATPLGGVCLMGGATEDDEAMKWFLNRANGGDVLVLRASGSDGYNNYFFSELGVNLNSVETIVFHDASASEETYIHERIQQAEAIWFAGGNQWNYISYWRNTPIQDLINTAVQDRNIVIGGTSAGMAILGSTYFSAENNTVTSPLALQNPYNANVTVDNTPFLTIPFLENVITDTHYDDPDRRGRHVVFLARMVVDDNVMARGIACDEYTAVCIDNSGIASVYGEFPDYDDNAYFLQVNCELNDYSPENCSANNPLTWDLNGEAVKVYAVKGTQTGSNTFDLTDWKTGSGGAWQNWSVVDGNFTTQTGAAIDCNTSEIDKLTISHKIYPNPANDFIRIEGDAIESVEVFSVNGSVIQSYVYNSELAILDVSSLEAGAYFIQINHKDAATVLKFVKH